MGTGSLESFEKICSHNYGMLRIKASQQSCRTTWATSVLVLLVTVAGTVAQTPVNARRQSAAKPEKSQHWTQTGRASWYGRRFQGQRTASGELFDRELLTCAHPTLPIGALVRVTNLANKRTIMVRVNDRGPIVPGRIVDLSYAAAHALGFRRNGIARVRLDRVEGAETAQLDWPAADWNTVAASAASR